MIEKLKKEEIVQLVKELENAGYVVRPGAFVKTKQMVMKEEAERMFGGDPFVCATISGSIYAIADDLTDNFERIGKQNRRCKDVSLEREPEYRRIVRGILDVIKPHYGVVGFRDKWEWIKDDKEHCTEG